MMLPSQLHTLPGAIIGAAGLLLALGVIGKYLRQWFRWLVQLGKVIRAMDEVISRELEHNHGSSIKDDITGIAVAVGLLQRATAELTRKQDEDIRALHARIEHHHPTDEEK